MLFTPPAQSMKALTGGYNANTSFNTLADNQINDAVNVEVTRQGTIKTRLGCERYSWGFLKDTPALPSNTLSFTPGSSTREITGFFQMIKSGFDEGIRANIVAGKTSLYEYTSQVAIKIMDGLAEKKEWYFEQIQDPRNATDDCIIGVNGYDDPIVWNGTEDSAVFLSDISGASGVPKAKYIASIKGRIILANIKDDDDVDSESKFVMSGFGASGEPTPHVFPPELFAYAGGSDRYGGIQGITPLNGNIAIFKRNTTYMFNLGGGTSVDADTLSIVHDFSMQQMDENIGCIAPRTIASVGNAVIFLSDHGLYYFNGQTFTLLSEPIQPLIDSSLHLENAAGVYHRALNEYWLSISPPTTSQKTAFVLGGVVYSNIFAKNTVILRYDLDTGRWQPPQTEIFGERLFNLKLRDKEEILGTDIIGSSFILNKGLSNGTLQPYNGLVDEYLPSGTLIWETCGTYFPLIDQIDTQHAGYNGLYLFATEQKGTDAEARKILRHSNLTGSQAYVTFSPPFTSSVNSNTTFAIGGFKQHCKTKDYDFGSPDLDKLFRSVTVWAKGLGDYNYKMNYIVDFNYLSNAGTATISQYNNNFLCWTAGDYATGTGTTYSGTIDTLSVGASSINVSAGTDLSASNLSGFAVYIFNSSGRTVFPMTIGECDTLNLTTTDDFTASLAYLPTGSSYFINTNILLNTWGNAKWGPDKVKRTNKSLRFYDNQNLVGKHFALRFHNDRAGEPFEIYGFDIRSKNVGRRE